MNTVALSDIRDEYTKVINISPKHQITIPQKFFSILGFGNEAVCILRQNEIIIKPFRAVEQDDFSELILADLISRGYTGEELLNEFKAMKTKIRTAAQALLQDAENAADGIGEYYTEEDVFGEED